MEKPEQQKTQAEILNEHITTIERIPAGVVPRAETILILLKEKPATEVDLRTIIAAEVIAKLQKTGLFVEELKNQDDEASGDFVRVGISWSKELLDELKQTHATKDHRRYGELMGYPSSAIDAFLGENGSERLSIEEQEQLTKNLPHLLTHFVFSKNNSQEELLTLKKWLASVVQNAPGLLDDLYPYDEAEKFREYLSLSEQGTHQLKNPENH